ncbi:hypothetical protein [Nevskia sp.]|uniref:hypothetical protein n=1 Tax=Nevskia sp. TaxID=1929292 RepID=UPI0025DE94A6|nr:hypothetical protein [Nevskia sp.]
MPLPVRFRHLAVVGLLVAAGNAHAHQIWIEQDAKGAALYFGEFRLNLHEDSPGILDKLAKPVGLLIAADGAEQGVVLEKKTTEYVLASRAAAGQSLLVEDLAYPVREARGELGLTGKMLWVPHARYVSDLVARKPKLALDIVPTGEAGAFRVFWNGEAVPGAKVEVVAMSGWSREVAADETGTIHALLPWRGRYLLLSHHTEKTPGEAGGKPYDFITHTSTLSFELAKGDQSPPVPALAAPSL